MQDTKTDVSVCRIKNIAACSKWTLKLEGKTFYWLNILWNSYCLVFWILYDVYKGIPKGNKITIYLLPC